MKKLVGCVTIIIIIIFLVVFLKSTTTKKYSHNDIRSLVLKGIENMDNMNNVYFEKENKTESIKYYYKGNKRKMIRLSNEGTTSTIEDSKEGKSYLIKEKEKIIFINTLSILDTPFQNKVLELEKHSYDKYTFNYTYIREEKLDNKDCLFVKGQLLNTQTEEYSDLNYNSNNKVPVFWIEKSTGFVIGTALMQFGENVATPDSMIKNIKFGEVKDNDFELPNDYKIIEINN